MDATERECTRCKQMQALENFSRQKGGKYGRLSVCRACKITEGRAAKESGRWPSFSSSNQRTYRLLNHYGMTDTQYDALLVQQEHKCALCAQLPNGNNHRNKKLVVDHDHDSGHIRGLLCSTCNMWLGNYEEFARRIGAVEKIASYLSPNNTWVVPSFPETKEPPTFKSCRACGVEKPLEDFTINPGGYRRSRCKPCEAARVKGYYASNEKYREAVRARSRQQRKVTPT